MSSKCIWRRVSSFRTCKKPTASMPLTFNGRTGSDIRNRYFKDNRLSCFQQHTYLEKKVKGIQRQEVLPNELSASEIDESEPS